MGSAKEPFIRSSVLSDDMSFGVNVVGHVSGNLGLGVAARGLVQLLLDKGLDISILDIDPGYGRYRHDLSFEFYFVPSPEELKHPITILVFPPPSLEHIFGRYPGLAEDRQLKVALSMWELPLIPHKWFVSLAKLDAIIAESEYMRYALEFGLPSTTVLSAKHLMQLPAGAVPNRKKFGIPRNSIVFFTSFEPLSDPARKNPIAVVRAFQSAFKDSDLPVQLLLKVNNSKGADGKLDEYVDALRNFCSSDKRIFLIFDSYSYADLLSLYASCDVFVSLHRAEGLGLLMMEAMMLGKPVIATAWSGNMSFMDHRSACLVRYDLIPANGALPVYQKKNLGGETVWADPSIEDAAAWMKRLAESSELRKEIGERARCSMEAYQKDAQAAGFIDELRAIFEARLFLPRHEKPTVFPVAANLSSGSSEVEAEAPVTAPGQLYDVWIAGHAPQARDAEWVAERLQALAKPPRFHLGVIALAENEAGLATTIESLAQQFHGDWRLTIAAESPAPAALAGQDKIRWLEAGEGAALAVLNQALLDTPSDWVGMMEAGDRLAPQALFAFADKLDRRPDWQLAYSDEDSLDGEGKRDLPFFKTDFNLEMLRAAPFTLGGLMLVRHDLFAGLGGYQAELEGAEAYDLALRAWEQCGTGGVGHVADVLYHRFVAGGHSRRPADIIQVARRVALDEHFLRLGIKAEFEDGRLPGTTRVRYRHEATPLVSILIPTRNQVQFLQRCLETLIEKTAYAHYEVLVLDNGSDEAQAVGYLNTLRRAPPDRLRVIDCPGPFNFSAINNRGAREARGDYLVLLNNDTAVLEGDWLDELLALGQLPDVGIVGARLLFPNGRIQHAGVILGINDTVADHPFIDHPADEAGYFGRLLLPQELSAVTAACLLVKKSVYTRVGGLDEDAFKVSFNDSDFCLKVREAGHRIVWTPYATLLHEGSASQTQKGVEQTEDTTKRERFRGEREAMFRKWPRWIAFDPAYNRNLSSVGRDFLVELAPPLTWDPEWRPRPRVLAHPADRMGCGEYRVISPMRALNEAGMTMGWETGKYLSVPELLRMDPDSILFQRQIEWSQIEFMESYIQHSKAFRIFEIDDLITNIPVKSSRKKAFVEQKDLIKRFRKAVSLCHRFVVSTDYLAEEYRGYTDEVLTVPNFLERSRWDGFKPERRQGDKPRVGWAGSTTHDGDLHEIIDVVKATADEVDWVFFGMCPAELRPLIKEFHAPVALDDYAAKLATLNLDLAVAPLEDVPFNHGKSHLRLLEYGVMGYPVICTDITPYRGAYPVTRVPNKYKHWVEAIREHLSDMDELARRGDVLREHIQANWMLEDNLDRWLKAWQPS